MSTPTQRDTDRAREWLIWQDGFSPTWLDTSTEGVRRLSSLAALLAEERAHTLAEVWRVVGRVRDHGATTLPCSEILARLEKLT